LNVTPAHPASKPLQNGDFEAPGGHQIWKKSRSRCHHLAPFGPSLVESAGCLAFVVLYCVRQSQKTVSLSVEITGSILVALSAEQRAEHRK
jgi:hypothetical protein